MIEVHLFKSDTSNCPVLDFVEQQEERCQLKIYDVINRLKIRGTELVHDGQFLKKLTGCEGLYELRVRVANVFYRILLIFINSAGYLLNAFKKKTNETPLREISTALDRLRTLRVQLQYGHYQS